MAKRVETLFLDDMEETSVHADVTVPFSLEGTDYEIDLSNRNRKKLYEALAPFIEHARTVKKAKAPRTARHAPAAAKAAPAKKKAAASNGGTGSGLAKELRSQVRAWGKENGWADLGDRGRLPATLIAAYQQANG